MNASDLGLSIELDFFTSSEQNRIFPSRMADKLIPNH